jgi:hypothetical protein
MSESTLEIVNEYKKMGKDPEALAITFCKRFRRHQYRIWRALRESYGYEKAKDVYHSLWGSGERLRYFKETIQRTGIPKNAAGWAEAIAENWRECGAEPAFVTKSGEDEAIIEVEWCGNPVFHPRPWDLEEPDGNLRLLEFGYVDCYLGTVSLIGACLECFRESLGYGFEIQQTLNMGYPQCRFIIRKREKG